MAEHVVLMGGERNDYKILVENPDGKKPLVRPTSDEMTILSLF
jgi:hypothetical protein